MLPVPSYVPFIAPMPSLFRPPVRGRGTARAATASSPGSFPLPTPQRRYRHSDGRRLAVLSAKKAAQARRLKLAVARLEAKAGGGGLPSPTATPRARFSQGAAEPLGPRRISRDTLLRRLLQMAPRGPYAVRDAHWHRAQRTTAAAAARRGRGRTWAVAALASLRGVWSAATFGIAALRTYDRAVRWDGLFLFVDVANSLAALRAGDARGHRFVLRQLTRLSALRGCQVLAMV